MQVAEQPIDSVPAFPWKLWVYTNYDCNLRCRYCVAKSSPNAPRRAIGLANVQRLIDESTQLGFVHAFFNGGEPFLLPDIFDMHACSSARILTTAMLLHGARLAKLVAGSKARAVDGIKPLQAEGFQVRLGTTETPANSANLQLP